MPIEFKKQDGALLQCKKCEHRHFTPRLTIIELQEADKQIYGFTCPECTHSNRVNLPKLLGYHDKQLLRMTVKR